MGDYATRYGKNGRPSEYENCEMIFNETKSRPALWNNNIYVPAIEYCMNIKTISDYQGYLPSIS